MMTFSGQVAWHSPHCTQASSAKRSVGRSGSSSSAPVGQADTQARQSVQPSTLTSTVPNGAPAGSATTSTGAGAARCSSRKASRITSRLPPNGAKLAGRGAAACAGMARSAAPSASGSSVSMVATRSAPKPRPIRIGSASAMVLVRPAMSWRGFARSRKRKAAGAIGEGRRDRFESDLRHLVDRERQRIRRQAVAMPRQRVDQLHAMRLVMQEHDRMRAAGFAIGRKHCAQLAHQRVRGRQRVGRGAGRTDRGALAAAGANLRIDRDVIAGRRDRAGRTEIEAAAAADDLGTRMRAQVLGEGDIARLVEGADEVARLEHRAQHRRRIAGIGAQIAVAQIGRRETAARRRTDRARGRSATPRRRAPRRMSERRAMTAQGWRNRRRRSRTRRDGLSPS